MENNQNDIYYVLSDGKKFVHEYSIENTTYIEGNAMYTNPYDVFLEYHIYKKHDMDTYKICKISVPNYSETKYKGVYVYEKNKIKILKEIPFMDMINNEKQQFKTINRCPQIISFIENPSPRLCLEAVRISPYNLQFIDNQTPEMCMCAVKGNGLTLRYVKEQTPEICMAAVKQNGLALQYVKEQTPEICLAAVKQNGYAYKYVSDGYKTYEMRLNAIRQNGSVIRDIYNEDKYKGDKTKMRAVIPDNYIYSMEAVKQNGIHIRYIQNSTEICLAAVQNNGLALKEIYEDAQTHEICLAAVSQNGLALEYVEDQIPEICMAAVNQNKDAMRFIHDKSLREQIEAQLKQSMGRMAIEGTNKIDIRPKKSSNSNRKTVGQKIKDETLR